ncbi:MAG: hypothetical protein H6706_29210 [Myxococcales bacterium]|nr:hypothetical protein [Myxococcales bacterium]
MKPSELKVPTPWLPAPPQRAPGAGAIWLKGAIGAAVGGLCWLAGWTTVAIVAWSVAGLVTALSLASPAIRHGLDRGLAAFGRGLGRGMTLALLTPLFLVGFTVVRGLHRLGGRDPLHLRPSEAPSYWLPAAEESRRARRVRSLFAAEPIVAPGRRWPMALAGLVVLAVLAEITLRIMGFGDPVLYVDDPVVGYYPQPDQAVSRQGNQVRINAFGMRSRPVSREKPAGTFRVLILGDSTAFGGSYLDQDAIYPSLLERHLRERAGGRPVEVLNAGVNGWGPYNELAYIQVFGDFDCDLALLALPYGDVYRPLTGLVTKPFPSATHPPRLALEEVGLHLLWRVRSAAVGKPTAAQRAAQGELGVQTYAALARALAAGGAEVRVEVLPTPAAGLRSEVRPEERQIVDRLAEAVPAPVGFPAGLFAGEAGAYHDFVHLAGPGHVRYAAWLAERIAAESAGFQAFAAGR